MDDDTKFSENIKNFVDKFLRSRNHKTLKEIFDKHKIVTTDGCRGANKKEIVPKEKMHDLWKDLLMEEASKSSDDLFKDSDANGDGEIDLEDLKRILECPNDVERWIATIPIGPLVASALASLHIRGGSKKEPLRSISTCTDKDLDRVLEGMVSGLKTLMRSAIDELKVAYKRQDELKSKHDEETKLRVLSCGEVPAFYGGLGDRVGKATNENSQLEPAK
jgi:hypothetical protein